MPPLTISGAPLLAPPSTTYTVTEDTGTTSNGQAYSYAQPDAGPGWMGVVVIHGILQTGASNFTDPVAGPVIRRLAQLGFPVVSGDMFNDPAPYGGAGDGWGNTLSESCLADLIDVLHDDLGADPGPVALFGISAGGPPALVYAANHPDDVACFAGIAPVVHTAHTHADQAGLAASMNAAFNGGNAGDSTAWTAALPAHNPTAITDDIEGLRARIWYGDSDDIVLPADVEAFAAAIDADTTAWLGEHSDYTKVNPWQVVNFIVSHYPPAAASRTLLAT